MTNSELARELHCTKRQASKIRRDAPALLKQLKSYHAIYCPDHGGYFLDGMVAVSPVMIAFLRPRLVGIGGKGKGIYKYVAA